jgi:hypothetical protein
MNYKKRTCETIAAGLIFLFIYTGLSKYMDLGRFYFVLYSSPLLGRFARALAIGLPGTEIIMAILLSIPKTRKIGFYSSSVLLLIFTIYLSYMIATSSKLPCSCGGVISKLSWKNHIFFNLFWIVMALIGVKLSGAGHQKEANVNSIAVS